MQAKAKAELLLIPCLLSLLLFHLSLYKVPINGKWLNWGLKGEVLCGEGRLSVITTHGVTPTPRCDVISWHGNAPLFVKL